MANQQHIQILVANERVQQALSRITQARSVLYPQLEGNAYQTRQTINLQAYGIVVPVPGFETFVGPFNSFDARIRLSQTLFDAAALKRLQVARKGKQVSQAEREKTRQDVLALVANLYLDAQRTRERIPLIEALVRRDQTRLRIARSQNRVGLGSEYEITQAQAGLADSKSKLEQAKAQSRERELDLLAALGLPANTRLKFPATNGLIKKSPPEKNEIEQNVASHPDVRVAQKEVQQANAVRKSEVAEYFPKLTGTADYGVSGANPGNADDTYSYGGQLTIPIFQGRLRGAKVQEATSLIREKEDQLSDTRRQTLARALRSLASLRQTYSLLQAADAQMAQASQQLNLAREREQSGLGSELEVVEATANRAGAQDRKNEAVATYRLAWVTMAHSLGDMDSFLGDIH